MSRSIVDMVRAEFDTMRNFRKSIGYDRRLRDCLFRRLGKYSGPQLAAIRELGGSEVYVQLTASKCGAAASFLREVYITSERPWTIRPTPVPTRASADDDYTVAAQEARDEVAALTAQGFPLGKTDVERIFLTAIERVQRDARSEAEKRVATAQRLLDDMLVEGGFYQALDAMLEDFVTYPLAVMAGPRAVLRPRVDWSKGTPEVVHRPVLTWGRVDPEDFWWSPGARRLDYADVIERMTVSRAELEALSSLPGYNAAGIKAALDQYAETGWREDQADTVKSDLEGRQQWHDAGKTLDLLMFTGRVRGSKLKDMKLPRQTDGPGRPRALTDRDHLVTIIICGHHLVKVHIDPDPLQRTGYFAASYEPVPNSVVGTALPELFSGSQDIVNALTRAAVNNAAMASGPQVVIDENALADPSTSNRAYPWKLWFHSGRQSGVPPISFFQPSMNAGELMQLLQVYWALADEASGVPRYLGGSERVGGAGRTASGLAMLMGNSTRVMQSVASNIDQQVLRPTLEKLHRLVMLTLSGDNPLAGDDQIEILGATNAKAREADRMRLLEYLSLTSNPVDQQLLGPRVRVDMLLDIARQIGLDIPTDKAETLLQRLEIEERMARLGPGAMGGMMMAQGMGAEPAGAGPRGARPAGAGLSQAGQQMPPAAGLANPGVDMDVRGMLASRGVATGPLPRM